MATNKDADYKKLQKTKCTVKVFCCSLCGGRGGTLINVVVNLKGGVIKRKVHLKCFKEREND